MRAGLARAIRPDAAQAGNRARRSALRLVLHRNGRGQVAPQPIAERAPRWLSGRVEPASRAVWSEKALARPPGRATAMAPDQPIGSHTNSVGPSVPALSLGCHQQPRSKTHCLAEDCGRGRPMEHATEIHSVVGHTRVLCESLTLVTGRDGQSAMTAAAVDEWR